MKIVVVGAGIQGRVIAQNLVERPEKPDVVLADLRQPPVLPEGTTFQQADVLDQRQADQLVKDADAVVLAVPSSVAHEALANLLSAGVPIADVSFTPDPPLSLDDLARRSGACCVVDVGVAPGLSHILVGNAYSELGGLDSARILVGGLPQDPPPVFRQAVYFNPHDLLSEYIRPARARKGGKDISPAPLDAAIETHKDAELGALEAFLSDGLRSLLTTYKDVPDMAEMTLRWPGHLDTMKMLAALGLLDSPDAVRVLGDTINERFPSEQYPDVMLMLVEASKGKKRRAWRLIDRRVGQQSAMSRTTGFTTAAVAMVLARKQFTVPGVHAPEQLGETKDLTAIILKDLADHGVSVTELVPA
jgi:saccharopine dehydrogenase-like NADP-dependent oxidoreductase